MELKVLAQGALPYMLTMQAAKTICHEDRRLTLEPGFFRVYFVGRERRL